AHVDPHHLAAAPHPRREVADDYAGAAADLEHALAGPDGDEPQEAPAQPRLSGCPAARLEASGHLVDVVLPVGMTPGIRMRAHARRVRRRCRAGRTARCRSTAPARRPRAGSRAISRCRSGRPDPSRARPARSDARAGPSGAPGSAREGATRPPRSGAAGREEAAYNSAIGLDRHRPEELFVLSRQLGRDGHALLAAGEEDAGVRAATKDLL